MALVDVYNIENMTGSPNAGMIALYSAIVSASIALVSALLAVHFKSRLDEKTRVKKINRDGETFTTEVKMLEHPLKRQIVALQNYKEQLKGKSFYSLTDVLSKRLDGLLKLSRPDIIEYFELMERKDIKKQTTEYVVNVFVSVLNIKDLIKPIHNVVTEPETAINALTAKHHNLLQDLSVAWYNYKMQIKSDPDIAIEPLAAFLEISKKYFLQKRNVSELIALEETLHEELKAEIFRRPEPFYIDLQAQNVKAIHIIRSIAFERKKQDFIIDSLIDSLKNQYKRIYGKEIDLTDVTV